MKTNTNSILFIGALIAASTNAIGLHQPSSQLRQTTTQTLSPIFLKVGDGFCRTYDDDYGNYDIKCTKHHPCTKHECEQYCYNLTQCVGYEYDHGKCEVHYETITHVKHDHDAECYEKVYPKCGFEKIGHGYCRDEDNSEGKYDKVCGEGKGYCTRDECKDYCKHKDGCTGIEYWHDKGHKTGTCELHYNNLTHVKHEHGVKCYKYHGPCH